MARYIDADELIKKIFPYDVVDKKTYSINAYAVYDAIKKAPTSDVAPKREVAKEIFEEIKKIITVIDEIVYDGRVIFSDKKNRLWHPISPLAFAKLEKKYLGEEIDIPTEVDCLGRRPKFRKEWHKANNTLVREIFEDIRNHCSYCVAEHDGEVVYNTKCYSITATKLDEIEKKYTGSESDYLTPSQVSKMTPKEVRENYDKIIESMRWWH